MSRGSGKSVRWASSLMQQGFTMYPNLVLVREDLTPHAKTLYGLLIHYAREDEASYPGQELLHTKVPCSPRGLGISLRSLEAAGLVQTIRRGRGYTNQYVLLDPADNDGDERTGRHVRSAPGADQAEALDRHVVPIQNGTSCRSIVKKTQVKETKEEPPQRAPLPATRQQPGAEVLAFDLSDTRGLSPKAAARQRRTAERLRRATEDPEGDA